MIQSPPLADNDWTRAEGTSPAGSAQDADIRPDCRFGSRPVGESGRFGFRRRQAARQQPSIVRRMFRFVTRFTVAVLIGVGATLGWQSYGDAATEMLAARAPALAPLLPFLMTKPPSAVATFAGRTPQLETMSSNLDAVRASVDQLAAVQNQMAQRIAALQAVEEDIRQKISFTPQAPAAQAAAVAQPKPAPPKVPSPAAQISSAPRPAAAAPVPLTR